LRILSHSSTNLSPCPQTLTWVISCRKTTSISANVKCSSMRIRFFLRKHCPGF
jgi:hypothetical protein